MTYNSTNSIISGMAMRSGFLLGILTFALFLHGCGRKGPLILPDQQAQANPPAPVSTLSAREVQPTDTGLTDPQKSNPSTQPANHE